MDERDLRGLLDKVKAGRMSRRAFVRRVAAVGLTAPMATQLLALSGVAMAQPKSTYKPTKRGGGGLLKVLWWQGPTLLNPHFAVDVAPVLGSDVPACLLSLAARGQGAGDQLQLLDDPEISGTPILLINPGVPLSTSDVFAAFDGVDRGSLGDWRVGRNNLEKPARSLVPEIGDVLRWLNKQPGANFTRMSGSGATCFALFASEQQRDAAAAACPVEWWHLATFLR